MFLHLSGQLVDIQIAPIKAPSVLYRLVDSMKIFNKIFYKKFGENFMPAKFREISTSLRR